MKLFIRLVGQNATVDGDSGIAQSLCTAGRRSAGIGGCINDSANFGGNQRLGAGPRLTCVIAGLQAHHKSGAFRVFSGEL
jgi:hypothetical protein